MKQRKPFPFFLLVILVFITSIGWMPGWMPYLVDVLTPTTKVDWSSLPQLPEPATHIWGIVEQNPRALVVEGKSGILYTLGLPVTLTSDWLAYDGSIHDLKFSFPSYCHGQFDVPYMDVIEYYERAGCGSYWHWQESYAISRDGAVWKWENELNVINQDLRGLLVGSIASILVTLLISFIIWLAFYKRTEIE